MAHLDPSSIDAALARFLDGDPEPEDGPRLACAMQADPGFASMVVRLLTVDDLLRQIAVPDAQAFLESLKLRLNGDADHDEFADAIERRLHAQESPPPGKLDVWPGVLPP